MNFKEFLSTLAEHRTKDIGSKENFAIALFESTTKGYNYDPSYAKKLATPSSDKHLTDDFRKVYKSFPLCHMDNFLKNNLRKTRLLDLLEAFNVDEDEKKDFDILTEAITVYFQAYMEIGDNENMPEFNNVYSLLVDQHGNGAIPQANEKALVAAKEAFYSALCHIVSLSTTAQSVIEYKTPLEGFFADINKVFRVFESKCNRKGRLLFREIQEAVLNIELDEQHGFDINNYLELIMTPGSLPIELEKKIKLVVYNNLAMSDTKTDLVLDIYDDFERKKIIEALSKVEIKDENEYHFTEYISFNIKGQKRNLINDAFYILIRVDILLNALEDELKQEDDYVALPQLDSIKKKIDSKADKLPIQSITFMRDGMFYTKTKTLVYAPSIETYLCKEDGTRLQPGDEYVDLTKIPFYKDLDFTNFEELSWRFFWHQVFTWEHSNFGDIMCEAITVTSDGKCRYYMFPPTCKAKVYRMIRKMELLVIGENTIGFVMQNIMTFNPANEKTLNMTSDERIEIGTDQLVCFGYMNNGMTCITATKEQVKKKTYTIERGLIDDSYIPLIIMIKANAAARAKTKTE